MELFGFTINRKNDEKVDGLRAQSFITPAPDDGAQNVQAGGYYGTYVDMDASAKSETDLIAKYRETAMYPDCASAIEEIVTEAIASVDDEAAVTINLDALDVPKNIKDAINEEFTNVIRLLEFNNKSHDLFKRWYVDGRLYFQKIIDIKAPKRGILEIRQIDPKKIRKVRDVKKEKMSTGIEIIKSIDEFYIYSDRGMATTTNYSNANNSIANQGIKISKDSITFVPSGLMDLERSVVLGHLHKAIKPTNQLKMMEDALVIYRISRAPERRIFYIDVGNLPKIKAEQYLKDIMARYRNKIVYDSATGEIRDDRKFMSMLEDFWLPRREGGRGTEITTLPGGENLGQIADIEFFQQKLYQALNVPLSRMQPGQGIQFGRATEITRDELKFAKFVGRLRKKFNVMFDDILKTQLVLKGVIVESDWDSFREKIHYRYAQDQYFQEMKETESIRNRIDILTAIQPFVGSYFSQKYVKRNVLRMTDDEIETMDKEIAAEPLMTLQGQEQPDGAPQEQQPQ